MQQCTVQQEIAAAAAAAEGVLFFSTASWAKIHIMPHCIQPAARLQATMLGCAGAAGAHTHPLLPAAAVAPPTCSTGYDNF
jgi:hypothetical protein